MSKLKGKNAVITVSKEANEFAKQVIENNLEIFKSFDTPTKAFNAFKENFPDVLIDYDRFWTQRKKVYEANGLMYKKNVSASENVNTDTIISSVSQNKDVEIRTYDPRKEKIKEEIFHPYKSNKFIDKIISKKVGLMPGTTIVFTGGPSVGKTTVALDMLYSILQFFVSPLKKADKIVAESEFIYFSSEMKKIDLQAELEEKVWMNDVKSVLMSEYQKHEYKAIVEKVITYGYRVLVIDSFQNIVEKLSTFCGMTVNEAANFLLYCIERANSGDTTTGHNTAILLIQQVTKGGVFVGKNNLKHDTTAMLEFKFDMKSNTRYCEFTKNRRNGNILFKKLYYYLDENNEVQYDDKKWENDRENEMVIATERERMNIANDQFTDLFLSNTVGSGEVIPEVPVMLDDDDDEDDF